MVVASVKGTLDTLVIKLLRPAAWVAALGVTPGAQVGLALEDLNVAGMAEIVAVGPLQTLRSEARCPVTGTVRHLSDDVLTMSLDGSESPLQVTKRHRLFSADRGDWVAAEELGEGEKLVTKNGTVGVRSIEPPREQGVEVFNLEVTGVHRYYVHELGVLAHNQYAGAITYGENGVEATITADMINTGTRAAARIRPPGWVDNAGFARGHLLGRQLGGSGTEPRNLVTLFQNPANHPVMSGIEAQVRAAVASGQTVNFGAMPIYRTGSAIPVGVTVVAEGSGGFNLAVSVLNAGY